MHQNIIFYLCTPAPPICVSHAILSQNNCIVIPKPFLFTDNSHGMLQLYTNHSQLAVWQSVAGARRLPTADGQCHRVQRRVGNTVETKWTNSRPQQYRNIPRRRDWLYWLLKSIVIGCIGFTHGKKNNFSDSLWSGRQALEHRKCHHLFRESPSN